jgi:hypothetical protein
MSSRAYESYIVAIDADGQQHFVAYDYSYSWGSYRRFTVIGEQKHEVDTDGGTYVAEKGPKLPILYGTDLASYFSDEPSKTMKIATTLTNIKSYNISQFFWITVHYISWHVVDISCTAVSAAEKISKHFTVDGVPEEVFGRDVENIAEDVLKMGIDGYAAYLDSVRQK